MFIVYYLIMIFNRLMNNKILLPFLFIGAIAGGDDHGDGTLTTAQAWGYSALSGIGIIILGLVAALIVIAIKKCIT